MRKKEAAREKLALWQERLHYNEGKYREELDKMDGRERQYKGDRNFSGITEKDAAAKTFHVRNISAELVEAQVDPSLPTPKVTAKREEDEHLAKMIEDMLRNEMDRLPMEQLNDMMERTVPIQGGGYWHLFWDSTVKKATYTGDVSLQILHPKMVIPQDGVFSGVQDMDYVILKVPTTKGFIQRAFGVDPEDLVEEEPELRDAEAEDAARDMVTMYVAFYKSDDGKIGKFSWVCQTVLEDFEDYMARQLKVCARCGQREPSTEMEVLEPTMDGIPGDRVQRIHRPGNKVCPFCGHDKWERQTDDFEILYDAVVVDGKEIVPRSPDGAPVKIPYYKPDIFPVFLQKNVSVYGQLLGESDLDKIRDQQNTTNRISKKIVDKLVSSGSYTVLPDDCALAKGTDDMMEYRVSDPAQATMIKVVTVEGDIAQDAAYLEQVYQEARQTIGITDSFQGRRDTTATSGKAKEFSAAQTAGRLESKRICKDACFSSIWEAIFKFKLAFADEPRPVVSDNERGQSEYTEFNRYAFLRQTPDGSYEWNDEFLFSCDTAAALASNREAMWQETRMNYSSGCFGDPTAPETQIMFWAMMEKLHYPMAGSMKKMLQEKVQKQDAQKQAVSAMAKLQAQTDVETDAGGVTSAPGMGGMPGVGNGSGMGAVPGADLEAGIGGMFGMGGMSAMGADPGMGIASDAGGMPGMGDISPDEVVARAREAARKDMPMG